MMHKMPVAREPKAVPAGSAAEAPSDAPAIIVRAGSRVREFTRGRVILGRAREADFQLEDPNVSRRHAALYWSEGRVMVEDLDSTNGTLVNGYPVSSTVLRPRDVLVIGDTRIEVELRLR
jgi:pSer/pThr/pTyr-binding forkhead associated (FHA) protein